GEKRTQAIFQEPISNAKLKLDESGFRKSQHGSKNVLWEVERSHLPNTLKETKENAEYINQSARFAYNKIPDRAKSGLHVMKAKTSFRNRCNHKRTRNHCVRTNSNFPLNSFVNWCLIDVIFVIFFLIPFTYGQVDSNRSSSGLNSTYMGRLLSQTNGSVTLLVRESECDTWRELKSNSSDQGNIPSVLNKL
ncbi:hypothetical protein SK128_016951, partial [Halocaridina rubra]